MKFTCEKALLQNAISMASHVVSPKSSIPALEGILVEAHQSLVLTGYNLETGIRTIVPADIQEEGSLVLSSHLFGEIIRKLPDDVVELSSEGFIVNIRCGNTEFNILGTDSEEFPDLPTVEYQNTITLEQSKLRQMISQTSFAVSTNEARPIHTGCLFEIDADGALTVVAVDGYRLALRKEMTLSKTGAKTFSFVVPAPALKEAENITSDTDEPVEVVQGSRHVMFKVGTTLLVSRRLEGQFLDYHQAIPRKNPTRLTIRKKQLLSSVERCSLIITEKQKSPLRCTFDRDILRIVSKTGIGDAYDECPIQGDGNGLEIGFNNKYLMDALKAAPAEELRLELNTPISPCVMVPADDSEHFAYMVLPVRLKAD